MNIPEEAVEAAAKAVYEWPDRRWDWDQDANEIDRNNYRNRQRVGLEAGARFIKAQALREVAEVIELRDGWDPTGQHVDLLRELADELEGM